MAELQGSQHTVTLTACIKLAGQYCIRLMFLRLVQVSSNKRYAAAAGLGFTVAEVAKNVEADFGKIDILVHSLANGPEVTKPLLETSRKVCCHTSSRDEAPPCHCTKSWSLLGDWLPSMSRVNLTLPAAHTGVLGSTERICILLRLHAAALWAHHESWRRGCFPHISGVGEDHSWWAHPLSTCSKHPQGMQLMVF